MTDANPNSGAKANDVQRLLTIQGFNEDITPGIYELTLDRALAIARPGYTRIDVSNDRGAVAVDAVYAPQVVTVHVELDASAVAQALKEAAEKVDGTDGQHTSADVAEMVWQDALRTLGMLDLLHSCWVAGAASAFSPEGAISNLGHGLLSRCYPLIQFMPLFGMLEKSGFTESGRGGTKTLTAKALVLLSVVYAIRDSAGHEADAAAILETKTMEHVRASDYGASIDALLAEGYIARTPNGCFILT